MTDDATINDEALREMVLSVGLGVCADVLEKSEAAGLMQAHLRAEVEAAGATWRMDATYYSEPQTVSLTAQVISPPDEEGVQVTEAGGMLIFNQEQFRRLFGQGDVQVQVLVPVAWIKLAHSEAGRP